MIVLAIDDRVPRLVAAARHFSSGNKARIDDVAEFRNDHEVVQRYGLRFAFGCVKQFQVGLFFGIMDGSHQPQTLVALSSRAARGKHAHLITPANRTLRQLHSFGPMPLEIQAKGQPRRQRPELALQVGTKLWVFGLGIRNQISQSGHNFSLIIYR